MDNEKKIPDYQTIKVLKQTLQLLRFIHAATGEPILTIVDRLAREEWQRLQKREAE